MNKELVNSILKLSLNLPEGWIFKFEDIGQCICLLAPLDKLCDNMSEVDWFSACSLDLFYLVFVEDMTKISILGLHFISLKLHGRESELTLLHVVIDLFIKVLTHICLKNNWEMIPEPLAIAASIQS